MHQVSDPRAFDALARLYGAAVLARFQQAHVCVLGVGGVGSWAAEALTRSAIGRLTIIDPDHVAVSNLNRQVIATSATLGAAKVKVLRERLQSIQPACEVTAIEEALTCDNLSMCLPADADAVIDCIDNARVKAALIAHCRKHQQLVVTVGGTGGKTDASCFQVMDLSRTEQDPLLSRVRKQLRQQHGFARQPHRRFAVPAVCSTEIAQLGDAGQPGSPLACGGYGSVMHVTATAALLAVGEVLRILAEQA
jgi:tRNA A37 threonylcarbamoyladenosine dehydratase